MAVSIEELRKEKERLEREREEIEKRLQDALRKEREETAQKALPKVWDLTDRIEALKVERQQVLDQVREAAPKLGDFSFGAEDYRLTLAASRGLLKQPDLLEKTLTALRSIDLHVEPRLPRFRLFRNLHAVGTLHVSKNRISIATLEPVLDGTLIQAARDLAAAYPGLVSIEMASERKERRVREGIVGRLPDGDYAATMAFHGNDTGSLDAVLPFAIRALDHAAAFRESLTPAEEARLFESWPAPISAEADSASAA